MTSEQYCKALEKLRLTVASKKAARVLCISVRQSQRYAAGAAPIPLWLARLIELLLKRGAIPRAWRK